LENHKSGFVNIIGRPNVGKSTLMNALVGERMSIITNKPQTTRHRIIGIVSDEDYQVVFSDTPGIIQDPSYKMHKAMNKFVRTTFEAIIPKINLPIGLKDFLLVKLFEKRFYNNTNKKSPTPAKSSWMLTKKLPPTKANQL